MADPSSTRPIDGAAKTPRQYNCMDDDSIRNIVTRVISEEKAHVLKMLGAAYTDTINTVGFCQRRPVQILSPFDIGPGPLRRNFLEAFAEVCVMGDLYAIGCVRKSKADSHLFLFYHIIVSVLPSVKPGTK